MANISSPIHCSQYIPAPCSFYCTMMMQRSATPLVQVELSTSSVSTEQMLGTIATSLCVISTVCRPILLPPWKHTTIVPLQVEGYSTGSHL